MLYALLVEVSHRAGESLMATVARVDAVAGKPPRPLRAEWGFTAAQAAGWGAPAKPRETMPPVTVIEPDGR